MADIIPLSGVSRTRTGKSGARQTRREGWVPGVIYGDGKEPLSISVDPIELEKQANHYGFRSHVFEVDVDGTKHRVLAREIQRDFITGKPHHVDFLRVSRRSTVHVDVAVTIINEAKSPGIQKGGVLNLVMHRIDLVSEAGTIPEEIAVDLTGMEAGAALHAEDLTLPAGVTLGSVDPTATVVTIVVPSGRKAEPEALEEE